jgi:hypothetical protein
MLKATRPEKSARRRATLPAVAIAVMLAGCGGQAAPSPSGSASPSPAPSSSPSPVPSPSLVLKPILSGLLDRNGTPPISYVTSLGGFVVDVRWSDLQPLREGPIAAGNAIDQAITSARTLNATYHLDLGLKLRVLAGVWAPQWAKNLGGSPISLINPQSGAAGSIGRFWTAPFGEAYDQLESLLAAKYDTVPEVREVTVSRCTTFYDEPFIRDSGYTPNDTALLDAGYTLAADENCQREEIGASAVWQHTHVDLALNPYEVVDAGGSTRGDELFTESMMQYCRQILSSRCVLENNSLRTPPLQSYLAMYATMQSLGKPIAFQTATGSRIGSLAATLAYAISLGANSVELPGGYESLGTPSSLAATNHALAVNVIP